MDAEGSGELATAGVRVPPPLLFAGALALGIAAGKLPRSATYGTRARRILGTLSIVIGVATGASALLAIRRAGSKASPFAPTTALVTGGPFAFTRNPAYFGATSIYIGIALLARSIPAFVLLPVALALLDKLVVDKEERYLEGRFAEYHAYRARVPRWF